ncbi:MULTISPECIES: helix-turn-helix domain-containing protein [Halomonadaceae]|uniref:Helix-turn-helix transcriptional regulator n=2 Tax=Halomonas TaxID=2745 RepID=A0ABR9F8U9_9GAMM|nr:MULTISPECIES: helix-turn-helix transcriptional regulator [Halomonas]MBE0402908.1 helix-turn-helix transcriptional regulator [Halomonas citrativorans]MBE0465322.1 helix-turn-helix transcriptional regulator [Halomonas colorata]
MSEKFNDIGDRLRAFRLGSNIPPEIIADKIGVSRAALYRYEKGALPKLETLEKISEVLSVSMTTLLGVGVEYLSSCVSFMERMRQIEVETRHISAMFGPIAYLLTTPQYDEVLNDVLKESLPDDLKKCSETLKVVDNIMNVLRERKRNYMLKKPGFLSLMSASELQRFVGNGFVGTYNLDNQLVKKRIVIAKNEVEHIIGLIEDQPIGVQVGLLKDTMPNSSFQIFKQPKRDTIATSPFTLGDLPNVRLGVAMITSAPEAVKLHTDITSDIWGRSLKGTKAIDYIRKNILID